MTDDELWQVVQDREGRYSVWPQDRAAPLGWTATGFAGRRAACVAHIDATWTDPLPARWRTVLDARKAPERERSAHA